MKLFCLVMVSALGISTMSGCGSASAESQTASFVSVKGRITLNQKPLEGAMVMFFPQDVKMGDGASAVTNAVGEYELKTGGANGAVPGNYRVIVSRLVDPSGKAVVATPETPPANLGAIESLPTRYSDYATTTLKSKVAAQGGTFDFDLTTK